MASPITTGTTTTGPPALLLPGRHASKTAHWATSSEKARPSFAAAIRWFTTAWEWDWSTRSTMKVLLDSPAPSIVLTEVVTSGQPAAGQRVFDIPEYSTRLRSTATSFCKGAT